MNTQELTPNSTLTCKECGFVTSLSVKLEEHIQINHKSLTVNISTDDIRVFKCSSCSYSCSLNIKLKKHVEKNHEVESRPSESILPSGEQTVLTSTQTEDILDKPESIALKKVTEQISCLNKTILTLRNDVDVAFKDLTHQFKTDFQSLIKENGLKCQTMGKILFKISKRVEVVDKSLEMLNRKKEIEAID